MVIYYNKNKERISKEMAGGWFLYIGGPVSGCPEKMVAEPFSVVLQNWGPHFWSAFEGVWG